MFCLTRIHEYVPPIVFFLYCLKLNRNGLSISQYGKGEEDFYLESIASQAFIVWINLIKHELWNLATNIENLQINIWSQILNTNWKWYNMQTTGIIVTLWIS